MDDLTLAIEDGIENQAEIMVKSLSNWQHLNLKMAAKFIKNITFMQISHCIDRFSS